MYFLRLSKHVFRKNHNPKNLENTRFWESGNTCVDVLFYI